MIETLGNATLTETGATGPVQITGITFQDGDLCSPRYPTLFDEDRAKGLRFEPGFQILSLDRTFEFLVQLDPEGGVELDRIVLPLNARSLPPGLKTEWPDPFTCLLTLGSPFEKVTALRLPCHPTGREITEEEIVYGGVYLAIVNREEPMTKWHFAVVAEPGEPEELTIKLLGLDGFGRPVYDLFVADALSELPPDLVLEPTFRVQGFEKVSLAIRIATPPELDLRFRKALRDPAQVKVEPFEPDLKPPQLRSAVREDEGRRCGMVWVAGQSGTSVGAASTFYLEADWQPQGAGHRSFLRQHGVRAVRVQLDPTVIQPPSCNGGICV
jgi:hypothetical protein